MDLDSRREKDSRPRSGEEIKEEFDEKIKPKFDGLPERVRRAKKGSCIVVSQLHLGWLLEDFEVRKSQFAEASASVGLRSEIDEAIYGRLLAEPTVSVIRILPYNPFGPDSRELHSLITRSKREWLDRIFRQQSYLGQGSSGDDAWPYARRMEVRLFLFGRPGGSLDGSGDRSAICSRDWCEVCETPERMKEFLGNGPLSTFDARLFGHRQPFRGERGLTSPESLITELGRKQRLERRR